MVSRTDVFCCLLLTCLLLGKEAQTESVDPNRPKSTIEPTGTLYMENGGSQKVTFTCKPGYRGEATFSYCFRETQGFSRCSNYNTVTRGATDSIHPLLVSSMYCKARFQRTASHSYYQETASDPVKIVTLDKPKTPTISSNNTHHGDGDMIQLGCHTNTSYIGEYEENLRWTWKLNGAILTTGPDNVYNISKAEIGDLAGDYTCMASLGEVSSNESEVFMLC